MRWLDRIPDNVWKAFENAAVAVTFAGLLVMLAFVVYFKTVV